MPEEYTPVPHTIRAVTWPDTTDNLAGLVGARNVNVTDGSTVQIRNSDGEWTTLEGGYTVAVTDKGERLVLSPGAFKIQYQPIQYQSKGVKS
jgi:hypothetical protein